MSSHPHSFGRFCMQCGQRLASAIPEGDTKRRLVCMDCGFIHYVNPRPVAATIPERADGRILLTRRAIEPRKGTWVFPGGYMDVGETAEEAAIRETLEEAHLEVRDLSLLGVYTRPGPGVVVIVFRAVALGQGRAGHETAEVEWFGPDEIPWGELAFDSTESALRDFVRARMRGASGESF
ncbi:MAG: NUDIX hydrolase [Dehalococcoidia bacterium]|nr:NUDIX hydrolase [Chloroflexi bacterium CFX7]MCK6563363.1 NUDIX hydrolase [Dehalococcoidia bacterium]NUQ56270.1 NUDIX hydrolase [Dehalococcoidia bacterium]RIL03683.1 MAG: NUDIX hydrolase [bacterium]